VIYVVDARTATRRFPGIGRYVVNLVQALEPLLDADEQLAVLTGPAVASDALVTLATGPQTLHIETKSSPFDLSQQWQVPQALRRLPGGRSGLLYHSPYYLLPYRPGAPTVLTFHDLIPLRYPGYVSPRARLLFRATTALALRTAHTIVAVSEAARRDLLTAFGVAPAKVVTVHEAADPRFRPQPSEEKARVREVYGLPDQYFLYVGINKPHKNLAALITAYGGLAGSKPALVIAGPWDERYPEPRELAVRLGMGGAVHFLGSVAEADLPGLYAAAMAFVFPSRYEGFGLPVLEAMACGTPVACTAVSSLPEVAGAAALYFAPDDSLALTALLGRLRDDAALRADLQVRGLAQAARFYWPLTAQRTLEVYRRVAGRDKEA
jgi:alpha-1,3-rhamnosyl/mannosyltransferase